MKGAAREFSKDASVTKGKSKVDELASKAARGDKESLKQLLELPDFRDRFREICKFFARRYKSNADVLEQEAYERIIKKIDRFGSKSSFMTWASRVVGNLQKDITRKQNRQQRNDRAYEELVRRAEFAERRVEQRRIDQIALKEEVGKLSALDRSILELRLDHSVEEISIMIGLSPSQTRRRLRRILHRLQGVV